MKIKILVIGIIFIFLVVGFSGCNDLNLGEVTQFSITTFKVEPSLINEGETANLSWVVMSAQTVTIDNEIGNVSNIGDRIIIPTETTTYTLTAKNGTKILTATAHIIVNSISNNEENETSDDNDESEEYNETENNEHLDNPIAIIDTSMGTIKVELFKDKVPNTVANFISYANDGYYEGLVFHRVVDDFMIQGGGFNQDGSKKDTNDPINLEIHDDVRHVDGAIAMARTNDPNSATSQFYICDGAQSFLDDNYATFGVTIEGIDIVRDIALVGITTKNGMQNWPVEDVIINSITIEND